MAEEVLLIVTIDLTGAELAPFEQYEASPSRTGPRIGASCLRAGASRTAGPNIT
jgi:hypothetical protein